MNDCAFATLLRTRQLERRRYLAFICTMYPAVVGFNRALIRSIAKVDHVRQSGFVKHLAEQLHEEQSHNQLWRDKLTLFGIDHEALYGELESYLARFSAAELDRMTREVLAAVSRDPHNGFPGCFPDAIFPEPVLALCHHLWLSASDASVHHWAHFASQSGIEMVIFDVVTTSVLPGVLGHKELDPSPVSTQWWREHGKVPGAEGGPRTDEEKHLELSLAALNRSETANEIRDAVIERADSAMRLFAASLVCQDVASTRFPLDRFLK
jgi:hypothetical protein